MCANCRGAKLAQSAKDGQRDTVPVHMLHDNSVTQFTVKHSNYTNAIAS